MSATVRVAKVSVDRVTFHPHNVRRDLGDLRPLAASIRRFGVMQPVIVEEYGDKLRLRAGHRRLAAARLAGLRTIPALIHDEALEDEEWLIASVQENVMRRGLDEAERARAVDALRDLGCTWEGIGDAFGVGARTARAWSTTKAGPSHQQEALDDDESRVMEKIQQGYSIRQVAYHLGMTKKTADRIVARQREREGTPLRAPSRKGLPSYVVSKAALRSVVAAWRESNGQATVPDLLDALERLADTGKAADAMPDQIARQRRRRA